MTDHQRTLALSLSAISLPIGTRKKRFILNMAHIARHYPEQEISEAQARYLDTLRHHFRRQFGRPCECQECAKQGAMQL